MVPAVGCARQGVGDPGLQLCGLFADRWLIRRPKLQGEGGGGWGQSPSTASDCSASPLGFPGAGGHPQVAAGTALCQLRLLAVAPGLPVL